MLTSKVIAGFVTAFLLKRFDDPKPIPEFHVELWDLCCQEDPQVAIAAPRGHAKSTSVTFAYVLANVLFKQAQHVLIVSSTEDLASSFLNDIKAELSENDDIIEAFGIHKIIKDRETEVVVKFKDGAKFRILAKGSGQKLRGIKWDRKRPDLVVVDDAEDDEQVESKNSREKFRRWFYAALKPIIKGGGRVRIVGTILHFDSLLNRLMPPEKDPNTKRVGLKTFSTVKRAWRSYLYEAHDDLFTQILWPQMYSKEDLIRIRQDYVEQGLADVYSQEYRNRPLDEGTTYFKRSDFKPIENDREELVYYAGADFAISKDERADYTVFKVVGVNSSGRKKVVYSEKGRWDSLEIMKKMFWVQSIYNPEIFFVEADKIQKSIGPFIYDAMGKTTPEGEYQPFINLEPLNPSKDKEVRARPMQAEMRAGNVEWDMTADWFPDAQEEILRFPRAPHDDEVDSLSVVFLGLRKITPAPTPQELEDEEWENMESDFEEGASVICGY